MTTRDFLELLRRHPGHMIAFLLPNGDLVLPHFHITEIGHQSKTFIDCGGARHSTGCCLLQVWVAEDTDHRLKASKLLAIFGRAGSVLPDLDLSVEIECEAPVLTQLPLTRCEGSGDTLVFHTALKHADCMAKHLCLPDFSLPALPGQGACRPGSGCC